MGRRTGLEGFIMAAARAGARAARQAEVEHRRQLAFDQRQAKVYARESARDYREAEKKAKQEYYEMRLEEASDLTRENTNLFQYLSCGIIPETLEINDSINFEKLKPEYHLSNWESSDNDIPLKPEESDFIELVGKEPFLGNFIPSVKKKWLAKIENAKLEYETSLKKYENEISNHNARLEQSKKEFDDKKLKYEQEFKLKCNEIDEFKKAYFGYDKEAVISYFSMVLERSDYLIDWDRDFSIAYSPESKEILVEFRLPPYDIIPNISEYKYLKTKDEIEQKVRKKTDLELCYKNIICGIAIRTIHEIVESDQANSVLTIGFNGYISTFNPSNGKNVRPTIISVLTSKSTFEDINLVRVDPLKCIQGLSASVSTSPNELVAVKPIRELNMVDKRFVKEEDIASGLDNRPNLMELDPFQFENLVSNLFSKMGLETKQTRSSQDGGVDAIAFDTRPILGGKIVIQAKRYKNTVGVSAVRDLYGTMLNEGATKGILVTTSSYGPHAFEFSKDKPMELIDGGGLLYLLEQVGIEAKIILPD